MEFDLLMADKTLYAAQLLFYKGEFELAKDTALKGENYFSLLVSEYAKAPTMPSLDFDTRIDRAYVAHQELLTHLIEAASDKDKEVYGQVDYFSKTNYELLKKIRSERDSP